MKRYSIQTSKLNGLIEDYTPPPFQERFINNAVIMHLIFSIRNLDGIGMRIIAFLSENSPNDMTSTNNPWGKCKP